MTDLQKIKISIKTLTSLGVAKNQEELGKLLGYNSKSAFSQLVNGRVPIPQNFIGKLRKLHSSLDDIWKDDPSKNLTLISEAKNMSKEDTQNEVALYKNIIEQLNENIKEKDKRLADKDEIIKMLRDQIAVKSQTGDANHNRSTQRELKEKQKTK